MTTFKFKTGLLLLSLLFSLSVGAQTTDFDKAYEACIKINTGFAGGIPDGAQLTNAAETLSKLKTGRLPLTQTKGKQNSFDGHIYFSADFIRKCIDEKKIFKMASDYAKRDNNRGAGAGRVLITTIVIPAGKTYVYEIRNCSNETSVGCVAETTGLFSWHVKTIDKANKKTSYPDNIDSKTGRSSRCMSVKSNSSYKIILEITNTTKNDCSFAVVAK